MQEYEEVASRWTDWWLTEHGWVRASTTTKYKVRDEKVYDARMFTVYGGPPGKKQESGFDTSDIELSIDPEKVKELKERFGEFPPDVI